MRLPRGYVLSGPVYSGLGGAFSRVTQEADGASLVVCGAAEAAHQEALVQHFEAQLASAELHPHLVRAFQRVDGVRQSWLLYRNVAGAPLDVSQRWDIEAFWLIAHKLTAVLSEAHATGLVHGRLEASCVWWTGDAADMPVLLGLVRREDADLVLDLPPTLDTAPELIAGGGALVLETADVYGLGSLLYRLLSGQPALRSSGNLAYDVAANPPAPLDVDGVPRALASFVAKMLSKAPAARPRTLAEVRDELTAIHEGSKLPRLSLSFLPTALVGRAAELELLLNAVNAVVRGDSKLMFLEGAPGVGKSHLLSAFVRRLPAGTQLLGRGKFEQANRGQPYSAFLSACRNAISSALSSDDAMFAASRQRLAAGNSTLLSVLTPFIPELRHMLDAFTQPVELGPVENRNRFNRACLELLTLLCNRELPFVLVLDDLQWADDSTVALLSQLVTTGLPEHFLMVLSCRTNVVETAELGALLQALPEHARVTIEPFRDGQTEELCRSVISSCDAFPSLAATVQQRSGGNALYCMELLRSLAASGQLTQVGDHWSFSQQPPAFAPLSDTVIDLIRARLAVEPKSTQYALGAAAFIGSAFSFALLRIATNVDEHVLRENLAAAQRHGLIELKDESSEIYAFCHDRIQEAALSSLSEDEQSSVRVRLGRHYRTLAHSDQFALFHCLDHLNVVRDKLSGSELLALYELNLNAARRARQAIAFQRAAHLLEIFLESAPGDDDRFDALLLLGECQLLASGAQGDREEAKLKQAEGERTLQSCAALATSTRQKLRLLLLRLALGTYNQQYEQAVEHGLEALRVLGHPLPGHPSIPRVVARAVLLSSRMRGLTPESLERLPAGPPDLSDQVSVLGWLAACAHWSRPNLGALVLIRIAELTLTYRDNPRSSMGFACYGTICHLQGKYARAVHAGRMALSLAEDQDIQARSMVRFQALTFYGAFEQPPRALIAGYDRALLDSVTHGDLTASHLIDAAVTMLPYTGWGVARILEALKRYEREARSIGATTSIEAVGLVRSWCQLLQRGASAAEAGTESGEALLQPLTHASFTGARDVMRMHVEYLRGNDEEVLAIGRGVRSHTALKDSPFFLTGYAVNLLLATTRSGKRFGREAREAVSFLQRLASVEVDGTAPKTFRAPLLLASALQAHARGEPGEELLEQAIEQAVSAGQELLKAMCLERLAIMYGRKEQYAMFVEHMRDAAQAFQRYGASAKVQAIIEAHPGVDWSHVTGRTAKQFGVQIEGVMRSASAIAEVTATEELGPTLLRVIATTANAMRAFLFVRREEQFDLVAGCERDQADTSFTATPLDAVSASHLAVRLVRYVERTRESVELPRDMQKFDDDEYLTSLTALRGLLCVPLTYRAELMAILYLEGSCTGNSFSPDEAMLVTLLGRHSAIALSNSDTHRFEIEALQSKVNPHFLYNALSVVTDLIHRDPDAAEEAILKLTKLYRYMLSTPANSRVTLEKELALVRDYLELEKARYGDRLRIVWDVATEASTALVPALLLQPLAENAVNHGIRRNKEGGTVTISVKEHGDVLTLSVSDDGPGWYEGRGGTGFGLRSVRRRLELTYGDRAQLAIVTQHGVSVRLTIPW